MMMNMKKIIKSLCVFGVLFGLQLNISNNVIATEVALNYFDNQETIFNGTASTVQTKNEGLNILKNATSFSFVTKFKTSDTDTSRIHNLFFVGNETAENINNYVNIYVKYSNTSTRFGVELRGVDNEHVYAEVQRKLNDGNYHTFAFTIDNNIGYALYVDGQLAKKVSDATTRFIKGSISNPTYVSFGGGKRASGGNNYYAKGTMENTRLYLKTLSQNEISTEYFDDTVGGKPIFELYNQGTQKEVAKTVDKLKSATNFTVNTTYRYGNIGKHILLTLSNNNKYVNFFVDPSKNQLGLLYDGTEKVVTPTTNLFTNNRWYSIAYIVDNTNKKLIVYVDNTKIGEVALPTTISNLNQVKVGGTTSNHNVNGYVERAYVYDFALNETGISAIHSPTNYQYTLHPDPKGSFSTEEVRLFHDGYAGAKKYRIPSLLTTSKGTVLAAIDKRNQHAADWGNIDTFIRRSTDGGKTWDAGKTILDLIDNEAAGAENSAFLIDPSMVEDKTNNRIYMLLDMFPESKGFFSIQTGTDFATIDGKHYQKLHKADGTVYTVREEGNVYDENNEKTTYKVNIKAEAPYRALGDLYEGDTKVGNIYTSSAPIKTIKTSHLWLTYSDDDGITWSQPEDITPQVKEDWMNFMGTGPGVGIQLKNNRLVFPVYYTNSAGRANKQSSSVIYSDDHGKTWKRGESPNDNREYNGRTYNSQTLKSYDNSLEITESQVVELNNGDLKLFMRNRMPGSKVLVATSHDKGATWDNTLEAIEGIADPYCQLSVIHYGDYEGKELLVFSNPNSTSRTNGTLRIGEVARNGTISWTHSQVVTPTAYAYSSITKLPNGHIGVLYEGENLDINYKEVDLNWIKAPLVNKDPTAPIVENVTVLPQASEFKITVQYNQNILIGNEVKLLLNVGKITKEANYVSGSGTNVIVYNLPLDGSEIGVLTMKGYTGVVEDMFKNEPNISTEELYDFDIIPISKYTITTNNNQQDEGADKAIDNDKGTVWHSKWDKTGDTPHTLTITLDKEYMIDRYDYLPRQEGTNGMIKKYKIEVSSDGTTYTQVAEGNWDVNTSKKIAQFTPTPARYVHLVSVEGVEGFSSASEVRVHEYKANLIDKTQLQAKYDEYMALDLLPYTTATKTVFKDVLSTVKQALEQKYPTQDSIDATLQSLEQAKQQLILRKHLEQTVEVNGKIIKASYLEETFDENVVFNASYKTQEENENQEVYNLFFALEDAKVQPQNGGIQIEIPLKANHTLAGVYHVEKDGTQTPLKFVVENNVVKFTAMSFSDFVLKYETANKEVIKQMNTKKNVDTNDTNSTAFFAMLGISVLMMFNFKRKR